MKVIINMPEEDFNKIQDGLVCYYPLRKEDIFLLPKEHGRLIDADKLCQTPIDITDLPYDKCLMIYDVDEIADAPTVVDADKEIL